MRLPTTFVENLTRLNPETLGGSGQVAVQKLDEAGYEVLVGMRAQDVPAITAIASQTGVQEFCPNDMRKRFASEEMAKSWLEKERLFFQLRRKIGESSLAGYGWTGPEECKTEGLDDGQNTFAIRLSQEVAGQGLARLFTDAIISGSMAFGMRNIWLETWQSNIAAWKTYEKAGAQLVASKDGNRLTITGKGRHIRRRQIKDVRRFMKFTQTFVE